MKRYTRVLLAAGLLAAATTTARAQNLGMPLFTNPMWTGGVRIHVDAGQASDNAQAALTNETAVQGGVSLAFSQFALQALVASNWADIQNCQSGTIQCSQAYVSGALLGALRLMGGGHQSMALAAFAGVGTDFSTIEVSQGVNGPKRLNIPLGVTIGAKLGPLYVWGAPRYNLSRYTNCDSNTFGTLCDEKGTDFRWAAGVTLPIGPFGIRAAYDGGKLNGENKNFIGLGVSLGLGSQQ